MTKFLRNAWYVGAWSKDVATGGSTQFQIMNERVALFRTEAGQIHAIGDRCPHRFASLSKGKVIGEALRCPYHGLSFDGAGHCVGNPHGNGAIPPHAAVKSYPVAERFGAVWIWMGDEGKADPALLPDLEIFEQADYGVSHGYLHVDASYDLITDNLLDLSHAQFLHPALASPHVPGRTTVETKQEGDTVWHLLGVKGAPVSQLFRQVWDDEAETCFVHMNMRWNAPSHMFLDGGAIPTGNDGENYPRLPSAHLLTPETDRSTHYFWMVGHNRHKDDVSVREKIHAMVSYAFKMEDEPMVRDVYENMGDQDFWSLQPVVLPGDGAAIRARRILDKKIRDEDAAQGPAGAN